MLDVGRGFVPGVEGEQVARVLEFPLRHERLWECTGEGAWQFDQPLFWDLSEEANRFRPATGEGERPRELREQDLLEAPVADAAGIRDSLLELAGSFLAAVTPVQNVAEVVEGAKG